MSQQSRQIADGLDRARPAAEVKLDVLGRQIALISAVSHSSAVRLMEQLQLPRSEA
jgi:hypothetical protein